MIGRGLFSSFFLGGFECSSHKLRCGRRLDIIASTQHDRYCELDYRRLNAAGIRTVRDGMRWHLIEPRPYQYSFRSLLPMLKAARETRTEVIWDICHYGWPEDLDIFKPQFVSRFGALCGSIARVVASETDGQAYFCPMNEISFFAWAGGDSAFLNPFARERGNELKAQLVRATIEGIEAIRSVIPNARIVHVDPVIHITARSSATQLERDLAERNERAQYEAWDMVCGRAWPQLGGQESYLDIVGANYYVHNQWIDGGDPIDNDHPDYRPLHQMLKDLYERYRRPMFIAETGIENEGRPQWLRSVSDEVALALDAGVPVNGICLYPVVNHPGWDDDRHCHNGLWDYCDTAGDRQIYTPLAEELLRQSARLTGMRAQMAETANYEAAVGRAL